MIKKNAREDRTDNDASTIHQELMAHAIKLLGSEERARAMLGAGKLHLLVSKQRRALNSRWKPCGAFARSTGKPPAKPQAMAVEAAASCMGARVLVPRQNKEGSGCGKP
jgi:hypothetical protein